MPKWRDFFSVDSGKVTMSVQPLKEFVSEKATELAAQLQQSRSDAESSLHDLKEDVSLVRNDMSSLHGQLNNDLDMFSSRAQTYIEMKAEALTTKLGDISVQIEQVFSRLDDMSAQIKQISSVTETRFSKIEMQLDGLVSSDAVETQPLRDSEGGSPEDLVAVGQDRDPVSLDPTHPGPVDGGISSDEEEVVPRNEDDLDFSFVETTPPSDDNMGGPDLSFVSAGDDLQGDSVDFHDQDQDGTRAPDVVGVSSTFPSTTEDGVIG